MNKAKDYCSSDIYKVYRVVYKPTRLLIVRNFYLFMPVITVAMFSGRTQREKDRFAEAIT